MQPNVFDISNLIGLGMSSLAETHIRNDWYLLTRELASRPKGCRKVQLS